MTLQAQTRAGELPLAPAEWEQEWKQVCDRERALEQDPHPKLQDSRRSTHSRHSNHQTLGCRIVSFDVEDLLVSLVTE
jgi:hypothetical protein